MFNTAKIDGNDNPTWIAYNDTTGLPEPVRVDPIFGAVEVFVVDNAGGTYTTIPNARFDGNNINSGNGKTTETAYNETTNSIEALRCNSGGALLVKSV